MIFVTVGTQLPFDRLIKTVDLWAKNNPEIEIFAQIGPSDYKPEHIQSAPFLPPSKANDYFTNASLIVSHAGMGSVLTALKYKKPIVIMPRRASLLEHRNEHQLATAKWLCNKSGISVAWDETEIQTMLDNRPSLAAGEGISDFAQPELISRLRQFFGTV